MALELLWLVGSGLLFLDLWLESALELLLVEAVGGGTSTGDRVSGVA